MVKKYLKDYVEDGRYTIVIGGRMETLMHKINELYPTAVVMFSNANVISGKKLLIDKFALYEQGLKAVLTYYGKDNVVYENFSKDFVEGGNVSVNSIVTGYKESEQVLNVIADTSDKRLTKEDISYDLNGDVPKLYIKGQKVGVVSMMNHYVTMDGRGAGTNVATFVYLSSKEEPKQEVLSVNRITGEVFNQ